MNRQQKSLLLSLLFHGLLIFSIYAVSNSCAQPKPPIVIDFSVSSAKGPGALLGDKAAGRQRFDPKKSCPATRSEPQRTAPKIADQTPKTPVEQTGPAAFIDQPKVETPVVEKNVMSGTPNTTGRTGGPTGQGNSGTSTSGGGTSGISSGGGGIPASSLGGGGTSAEQLRNRYLKEHFAYIRDLIQRNISYPARARKMGWTGRVVISFIVHETGRVSDEKVVASSGFDLLDNNVISAIRAVAPFPSPPVKAELRVPIIYRLE